MNKSDLIELLIHTQNQTLGYFDLSEKDILKSYAKEKWNIRQILIHLADAETILHTRLKRIIANPKQVIWAFNQDKWEKELSYKDYPLALSKDLFSISRKGNIHLINKYYDNSNSVFFIHNLNGKRSLQEEFMKVAIHNQGHLEQIKTALKNE